MRPYTGLPSTDVWPADTSIKSAPASANILEISIASWGIIPSSPTQSLADIRTDIGLCSGHDFRMAVKTSRGQRIRFSKVPPNSSLRVFETGEMKDEIKYPCAAWSSIISKPARSAISTAATNSALTWPISDFEISRGVVLSLDQGMGDADMVSQFLDASGRSIPSQPRFVEPFRPECPI